MIKMIMTMMTMRMMMMMTTTTNRSQQLGRHSLGAAGGRTLARWLQIATTRTMTMMMMMRTMMMRDRSRSVHRCHRQLLRFDLSPRLRQMPNGIIARCREDGAQVWRVRDERENTRKEGEKEGERKREKKMRFRMGMARAIHSRSRTAVAL